MYNHDNMNPYISAEHLKRKVQFDIRFYFCRRGSENMENMQKDHFKIEFNNETEEWYVIKAKDELTKNHRDIEELVSGIMPENKTDPLCPVKSFREYLSHLNCKNKYMWQYPLANVDPKNPEIWYGKTYIGRNPLSKFMSEVSKQCGLSRIYTNHSIRVTSCTVLTRCRFSESEIMAVSGHKSVQSLAIYQKTQKQQKINMGKALFQSMTKNENEMELNPQLKAVLKECKEVEVSPQSPKNIDVHAVMAAQSEKAAVPSVQNKQNSDLQLVPYEPNFDEDISDIDLLSALCEMEENIPPPTTVSTTNTVVNTVPKTMFANCQIGTINVTIVKK